MQKIKNALLTVGVPVNHFTAYQQTDKYIVWAEDTAANAIWSDGHMQAQALQGTIHYFTRQEFDPIFNKLQQALNDAEISFSLNSIQYEDDTKYIHYEWIFEVAA